MGTGTGRPVPVPVYNSGTILIIPARSRTEKRFLRHSFRMAASGLSLMALLAGKYPAAIPTRMANPRETSTSQKGM